MNSLKFLFVITFILSFQVSSNESNVRRVLNFAIEKATSEQQVIDYIKECNECSEIQLVKILEGITAFGFYNISKNLHEEGYRISKEHYEEHISMSCSNGDLEILNMLLNESYYRFEKNVVFKVCLIDALRRERSSIVTLLKDKYPKLLYSDSIKPVYIKYSKEFLKSFDIDKAKLETK